MGSKFNILAFLAIALAVFACTFGFMAINATEASATVKVISKKVIHYPQEAGGDMIATVVASTTSPVVPDDSGNLVPLSTPTRLAAGSVYPQKSVWNTVYYTVRGTDHWVMWYTFGKSWTYSKARHRVISVSILGHWGRVNALAQALGWTYVGDNRNSHTFLNWNGYYHGQHFTRYIGRFEFKPIHVPIVTNTRNPNLCISVRYNGTYSFAGTKS